MSTLAMGDSGPEPGTAGGFDFASVTNNTIEEERRSVHMNPLSGSATFSPTSNRIINIQLPKDQMFLDVKASALSAVVKLSGSATDKALCSLGMASCVKSVVLRQTGGAQIVRMDRYNEIAAPLLKLGTSDWVNGVGHRYGMGSLASRQADGDRPAGRIMECWLDPFSIFSSQRYIPLWLADLELEITLEDDVRAIISSDANASYTWSSVKFIAELVRADPGFDQGIRAMLESGVPLQVPVEMYQFYTDPFNTSGGRGVLQQNTISLYKQQVLTYFAYFSLASNENLYSADIFDAFIDPYLESFQLQPGSKYIPSQPITGVLGGAQFQRYLHNAAFKNNDPISAIVDNTEYSAYTSAASLPAKGPNFVIGVPMGQARDSHLRAGLNLNEPPQAITVHIKQSTDTTFANTSNMIMKQVMHWAGVLQFGLGDVRLVD